MIFTDRSLVKSPLDQARVENALETIRRRRRLLTVRQLRQRGVASLDGMGQFDDEARAGLSKLFHEKCAYCESRLGANDPGTVSLHRPKIRALGLKNDVAPEHYWWLQFDWDNMYLSCIDCDRHKRNLFPVARARVKPEARGLELEKERALLLDPCAGGRADPQRVLRYSSDGRISSRDRRAEMTISVLGLNRPGLVNSRMERIRLLSEEEALWKSQFRSYRAGGDDRLLRQVEARLRSYVEADAPYAGLARQLLAKTIILMGATSSPVVPVPSTRVGKRTKYLAEKAAATWIQRIEIRNFRAIESLDVEFPQAAIKSEPWLMFIGENGVGKSSVLRAIALALADPKTRAKLIGDASGLVSQKARSNHGSVRLWFTDGSRTELQFKRRHRSFTSTGNAKAPHFLAYGSTRLLDSDGQSAAPPRLTRIGNLFNPRQRLGNPEGWLADRKRFDQRDFDFLTGSLGDLLSLDARSEIQRRRGRLFVRMARAEVPVDQLSDGFQSVIALATHAITQLARRSVDIQSVEGTILLDELEVHLHPTWKIRIVESLRRVFPRIRFIATTHDPLCLRGLVPGEIHHLFRDPTDKRVCAEKLDVPGGLRADQLLTGHWFGLQSTMDADTLGLMERHRQLLCIRTRTTDQDQEAHEIEQSLNRRLDGFGETAIERLAISTAAQLMARERGPLSPRERERLRSKLLSQLSKAGRKSR